VIHVGVTRSPTDAWTAQQLREATPYGQSPKYLIRDRDSKFGPSFARVAATSGIKLLKTPYHAPRANAICERFMGSVRHECLDHLLILPRIAQRAEGNLESCSRSESACRAGHGDPMSWQKQPNLERTEQQMREARKKGHQVPLGEVNLSEKRTARGSQSVLTPSAKRGKWRGGLGRQRA
jgi:transposase InsO family protein